MIVSLKKLFQLVKFLYVVSKDQYVLDIQTFNQFLKKLLLLFCFLYNHHILIDIFQSEFFFGQWGLQ